MEYKICGGSEKSEDFCWLLWSQNSKPHLLSQKKRKRNVWELSSKTKSTSYI